MSSSTCGSCPPDYEDLVPYYSRHPLPSESLVETSISPPPYLTRAHSNSTSSSFLSSLSATLNVSDEYRALEAAYGRPAESSSTSRLPASLPEPTSRYTYNSGGIELDLGPRYDESRSIPSYGRNAIIKGTVTLKKLSRVQAINITFEGRVQTMIMQAGLAAGHSAMNLVDISKTIYTASEEDKKGKGKDLGAKTFPFEFEIPSNIQDSDDPLPPTFRGVHPAMEGYVRYVLKVQVIKTGFWPRDTLSVAVHYLPKFYLQPEALLWPRISIMDAKRFGTGCDKWKTHQARLVSSAPTYPPGQEPQLSISIPKTAQAVANFCFIANATIRVPGASASELSHYVDKTSVQLIKVTTMQAGGSKSAHYVGHAKGHIQQIEKELVDSSTRIVRTCFKGGVREGEASWNVGQLITSEYFVRVTVKPDDNKPPIFQEDVPIQMFSHTWEQYESPFEIHDAPAYNLLLGSSLSGASPSLRG